MSKFADPRTSVPGPIRAISGGDPVVPVWVNGDRGVTFRIGVGTAQRFAKWAPAGSGIDLEAESIRLQWASRFSTVPEVLEFGSSAAGAWLVTVALPGESAITDRWKASPEIAVRVAGAGLRELHENGRFAGHVDLGSLGIADRWADLAIGTWSTPNGTTDPAGKIFTLRRTASSWTPRASPTTASCGTWPIRSSETSIGESRQPFEHMC